MAEDPGHDLVNAGLVTQEQLSSALQYQGELGGSLPRILVKLGLVKERQLLEHVAGREGLEIIEPHDIQLDEEILSKLPRELVEKHEVVPLGHDATHLKIALPDPSDLPAIEEVRFLTGLEVQVALVASGEAAKALNLFYHKGESAPAGRKKPRDVREMARRVGGIRRTSNGARAVAELDVSAGHLVRALAALLVDKRVIAATDLKEWVERLE